MKELTFIICSLLFLCSCSENQTDPQPSEPSKTYFEPFVGEKFYASFDAEGDDYTLKIDNPEVISWEYTKHKGVIRIKALSSGDASISVIDVDGSAIAIFHVWAHYFGSSNIEEITMRPPDPNVKSEVIVEAKDAEKKLLIENELWEYVKQRQRTLYTFDGETKEFTMDIAQSGVKYKGAYSCNIDSLILKYDNTTERYGFQIAVGRASYIIKADKTKEYQLLYPDADITSVKVNRVWYDWEIASRPM